MRRSPPPCPCAHPAATRSYRYPCSSPLRRAVGIGACQRSGSVLQAGCPPRHGVIQAPGPTRNRLSRTRRTDLFADAPTPRSARTVSSPRVGLSTPVHSHDRAPPRCSDRSSSRFFAQRTPRSVHRLARIWPHTDATARLARCIATLFNPILYPDLTPHLEITQENRRAIRDLPAKRQPVSEKTGEGRPAAPRIWRRDHRRSRAVTQLWRIAEIGRPDPRRYAADPG